MFDPGIIIHHCQDCSGSCGHPDQPASPLCSVPLFLFKCSCLRGFPLRHGPKRFGHLLPESLASNELDRPEGRNCCWPTMFARISWSWPTSEAGFGRFGDFGRLPLHWVVDTHNNVACGLQTQTICNSYNQNYPNLSDSTRHVPSRDRTRGVAGAPLGEAELRRSPKSAAADPRWAPVESAHFVEAVLCGPN